MLLFFDFNLLALAALRAILREFLEIGLFGFQDTKSVDPRVADRAGAGVNSTFTSWHSRDTLLRTGKQRKACKNDQETDRLYADGLTCQELFWRTGRRDTNTKPCKAHDEKRLHVVHDDDK